MWKVKISKNRQKSSEEFVEPITTTTKTTINVHADFEDQKADSNDNYDQNNYNNNKNKTLSSSTSSVSSISRCLVENNNTETTSIKNTETNVDTSNSNSNSNINYRDNNTDAFEVSSGSSIENQDNNDDDSNIEDNINYQNGTENIDALLARELNALTFQQRESINEEIHGVNVNQIYVENIKEIEETPELLEESFVKLQIVLNILQPDSFAYNRCQQLYGDDNNNNNCENENVDDNKDDDELIRSTSFINTNEFRIMFLRCELFDVPNAARRLILFVELMYELYGDIGIQRRIRIDDMSTREVNILKRGYV